MVTHANVPEPNESEVTIESLAQASEDLAANLATSRDKWTPIDRHLARLIEGLRIQFAAFALVARRGRVTDLLTLRAMSRAYEGVAVHVRELTTEATGARQALECVAKVSQLTIAVSDMVERRTN